VIVLELRVMRVRKGRKLVGLRVLGNYGKTQNWCTAWRHEAGRQATSVTVQRVCLSWLSECWVSVGAWWRKWVHLV